MEAIELVSDTPCLDCNKRYAGCHSKCENYKMFREKLEKDKQLRKEARKSIKQFYSPLRK